MKKRD